MTAHSWDLPGGASGSPEIAFSLSYNGAGQLTDKRVSDDLLQWSPPSTGTDAYTANGLNQYTAIDSASPVYDDNGNLTTDHLGRVFAYDAENVMRTTHASSGGAELGSYAYYADGMRRAKTVSSVTRAFFYDGDQEIAEYESTTLKRRYVRLPGSVDEPILMIDMTLSGGCTASSFAACEVWAHQDRLGSVIATTDQAGAVVERYKYGAYGELGSGSASGFPFRFTGQKIDSETGLYYYKARLYDPETGRFLQTDPIGYEDQMNLYTYAGNDPANKFDPLGLCEIKNDELVGCTFAAEKNGDVTPDEQKAVDEFKQRVIEVGKAIDKAGNEEQKKAFSDIKSITINLNKDERAFNDNGKITFFRNDLASGSAGERDQQRFDIAHEIFHSTTSDFIRVTNIMLEEGVYRSDDIYTKAAASEREVGRQANEVLTRAGAYESNPNRGKVDAYFRQCLNYQARGTGVVC